MPKRFRGPFSQKNFFRNPRTNLYLKAKTIKFLKACKAKNSNFWTDCGSHFAGDSKSEEAFKSSNAPHNPSGLAIAHRKTNLPLKSTAQRPTRQICNFDSNAESISAIGPTPNKPQYRLNTKGKPNEEKSNSADIQCWLAKLQFCQIEPKDRPFKSIMLQIYPLRSSAPLLDYRTITNGPEPTLVVRSDAASRLRRSRHSLHVHTESRSTLAESRRISMAFVTDLPIVCLPLVP